MDFIVVDLIDFDVAVVIRLVAIEDIIKKTIAQWPGHGKTEV